jgi:hypothetical protein
MEFQKMLHMRRGGALALALVLFRAATAATSFTNSLTGFTGDSTVPATQTAVGAAGFNFASTAGFNEDFTANPTIAFDASGAHFGTLLGGDGGRNYVRTNDSDYATVSFVAEITFTVGSLPVTNQQPFFGMGTGDIALFGVPDWSTQFASTFVQPEINGAGDRSLTTFRTQNDANAFVHTDAPAYDIGTHRLRMTFDAVAKTMIYAIDLNFAGGTFAADVTALPVDLNHIDCPTGCGNPTMPISADFFGPDGWPNEPSRIYFGGDDEVVFKDFSVKVSPPSGVLGDYNGNGVVDAADYVVWRNGGPLLHEGVTVGTVDAADYNYWRSRFGATTGSGSVAGSIPEPNSLALLCLAQLAIAATFRRVAD